LGEYRGPDPEPRSLRYPAGDGGPPVEKAPAEPDRSEKPKPAGRFNINTANAAQLEALPGIGPVIARRIIEGRPYRSVDDLDRVKGIGKERLEVIRPLVKVE
jgi:competence protein ComEA